MPDAYFHEDDYCQIELLPEAARPHCVAQMAIVEEFAGKHSVNGLGYTDVYVRPKTPRSVAELNVSLSELVVALQSHLPAFDAVFTGYGSYREPCPNVSAWGDSSFALFAECRQGFVQHLWLESWVDHRSEIATIVAALRNLPHGEEIIIADWSRGQIVALDDGKSLEAYFAQNVSSD